MENRVPLITLQKPGIETACLVIDKCAPSPVLLAVQDVSADAEESTGVPWDLVTGSVPEGSRRPFVVAGVAGASPIMAREGWAKLPEITGLEDRWDSYVIVPVKRGLVVAGSNPRGTMYGLYALSEKLFGTDPMKAFSDVLPERTDCIQWNGPALHSGEPRFRFRGIFINDEDALMSWRGEAEDGLVTPNVHAMIIESVCRTGGNMLAPPMWAGYMDPASRKLVEDRGLFYTASHLEVLLSNPQNYWDAWCREHIGSSLPYSFSRHPDELSAYWRESVRRHREYTNIWPVGLRGVTDCALWESDPDAPEDMPGRARLVSQAIRRQFEILKEETADPHVQMSLTMRDEVLDLFKTGELELPENLILVWDDLARKSIMRRLPRAADRARASRHGAYYHLNFCQDPRMQYLPMDILCGEISRIMESGATDYLLYNAGNVREISLLLRCGMKLAWNSQRFLDRDSPGWALLHETVLETFGQELAEPLGSLYRDVMETEYNFRVSQVTDCVAPLITSHELYDIWDNTSALDWIEEHGNVESIADYARQICFDDLPDRCWCFDPDRLPYFNAAWDSLLERANALSGQVPGRLMPFYESNLRVQIITSLSFCEWARWVLDGFRFCAKSDFPRASEQFEKAAIALDRLETARQRVATGKWKNWFRGEYSNVFKKSLWTLKPRWHAEDTRRLAELLR